MRASVVMNNMRLFSDSFACDISRSHKRGDDRTIRASLPGAKDPTRSTPGAVYRRASLAPSSSRSSIRSFSALW